jgi:acetyltransferase-like isoleucine patch superfamily enzyme
MFHPFFHFIRVTRDKIVTFFKCVVIGFPFDSSWIIHGRFIVVRPNYFHDRGTIKIGKRFHAQGLIKYNVFGIIQPNVMNVRPKAEIVLGDDVGVSGSTISASRSIRIGNRVLIGSGCVICDSDAHPIHPDDRQISEKTKSQPIIIEDDVFIGARSIILKGVTIGKGSVIGAGSVVTKDVSPMCIYAGNPAKFVKEIK